MKSRIFTFLAGVIAAVCVPAVGQWFEATGVPGQRTNGSSADIRAEFLAIEQNIADRLPPLTGNAGRYIRVNAGGTALEVADLSFVVESGTFTASFDDACTISPTAQYDYQRIGNIVALKLTGLGNFTCTSDSTALRTTGTPVPASIRPTSLASGSALLTDFANNGAAVVGCLSVTTAGNISYANSNAGSCASPTSWTSSGAKGVGGMGVTVVYNLGDP